MARRLVIAVDCDDVLLPTAEALMSDYNQRFDARLEKVIVFGDYPWNSEAELSEGMVRCVNWEAVTKELRSYAS